MSLRLRRKDGTYAPCLIFGCLCYQYIVSCYSFGEEVNKAAQKPIVYGVHSAVMTRIVGSEKEEFERISRNHRALKSDTWNPAGLQLELRACLLLNRFTRNITIMYASPSCELIFNIDPDKLLGKPLLLYIRADDLANFVEQVDQAKSSNALRHMRFWFQSPNCPTEIPCEALLYGAADAMVMILRKYLPFKRKQFITSHSSRGQAQDNGRFQFYDGSGSSAESMYSCSPESISSSVSSSISTSLGARTSQAHRTPRTPQGPIDRIRNLSTEQNRLRPLASVKREDQEAMDPETPLVRELVTDEVELVESELVEGLEKMSLRYIMRNEKDEKEKKDFEENDFFGGGFEDDEGDAMDIEEVEMPSSMRRHQRE
ncbi:hypothetical protein BGZ80_004354 [Entomortierella chlamydospora]|uniref:PAS domain-containing protein n=1 Tax=Entomortierella chlamydospora TaxID=101097 RepID=A0A9P6MMW7_9FUNG|nr:hypothetical protein BGZ80_004354 [Entomortierella chlamydospora]